MLVALQRYILNVVVLTIIGKAKKLFVPLSSTQPVPMVELVIYTAAAVTGRLISITPAAEVVLPAVSEYLNATILPNFTYLETTVPLPTVRLV